MLKAMVFRNFVHFRDKHVLNFGEGNGATYFIGASSTGKTAVLELVRRCMNSEMNSSVTNLFNKTEHGFAFCQFETDKKRNGTDRKRENVIAGFIVEGTEDKQSKGEVEVEDGGKKGGILTGEVEVEGGGKKGGILTGEVEVEGGGKKGGILTGEVEVEGGGKKGGILTGEVEVEGGGKKGGILTGERDVADHRADEKDEMWKEDVKFHKIMIYHSSDDKLRIRSKSFFERDGKIIDLRKNVKLENSIGSDVKEVEAKLFKDATDEDTSDDAAAFVDDLLNAIKKRQEENDTYDCYPALWDEITDQFVGLLPLRGPGTIQWTRSKYISGKFREKNYNDVCEQAEIINELLKSEDVDHKKEIEIFSFLTRPDVFEFEIKGSNEIIVKNDNKDFPLLKASVGIVEAKQFALLMSHKHFRTVCLEEPERGLHPQLIERMKEILHRHCEGKTVIVVTHSPAFIDTVSIKRAYIFSKERKDPCVRCLTNISTKLLRKELNISEIEGLKRIFFATRVLFVEGKSDRIVMQAIFRTLLRMHAQDSKENENIVDHQIVELFGKGSFESLQTLCKEINLPYCAVFDRDKYITVKDGKICNENGDLKVDHVTIPHGLQINEFLIKYFEKFAEELQNKNVFIWKDGELEDFLLSERYSFEIFFSIFEKEEGDTLDTLLEKLRKEASEEIEKGRLEELTREEIEELKKKKFEEIKEKKLEEQKKKKFEKKKKDPKQCKAYIKYHLSKGLSFECSEKIGKILLDRDYKEVSRLRTFLRKISHT